MTVYLDDWRQPARLGSLDEHWSHLVADDEEELHAFAARLGMRREWYQQRHGRPHRGHYDVPERYRAVAVALGARPVSWRELGRMLRDRRDRHRGRRPKGTTGGRPAGRAEPGDR